MKETDYLHPTKENIARLKSLPLFCDLEEDKLGLIVSLSKIDKFLPGEVIIKEGSEGRWIYILVSGAIDIRKNNTSLCTLRRCGDLFGEMFLLSEKERCATADLTAKSLSTMLIQ